MKRDERLGVVGNFRNSAVSLEDETQPVCAEKDVEQSERQAPAANEGRWDTAEERGWGQAGERGAEGRGGMMPTMVHSC